MSPLNALWHLMNFFAPAVFIGVASTCLVRWLWRSELRGRAGQGMLVWATLPAAGVAVAGLVLTGRDGKMLTYAAMVAACAVGLWWRCFVRKP